MKLNPSVRKGPKFEPVAFKTRSENINHYKAKLHSFGTAGLNTFRCIEHRTFGVLILRNALGLRSIHLNVFSPAFLKLGYLKPHKEIKRREVFHTVSNMGRKGLKY